MSRVACKKFTVSRDSMVSRLAARVTRRKKLPTDRGKLSDKESGFESSPNSPRAESALEQAHHTPGAQELALRGAQEEHVSLDSFEFIKKLGSGGYGSVVLVQKKGGRDHKAHYALKMTSLNRAALVERDILPRLENVPYTLDLAYAFCDTKLSKAYLVLPFAAGKDLFALAGPCSNPKKKPGYLRRMFHYNYVKYLYRVRVILAELCVAISHLHKLNILYRDLKLENILVFGDGHIRLADFGLSKLFEEGESTQISGKTGTPDYMAPEVLQSSGNFGAATTYSFEADLWGLGVIAYELVVGQLPFRGQEMAELEAGILSGLVEVPRSYLDEKFNRLARKERPLALAALSFVRALLQKRPVDRLTNAQIPHHIFFQDLDFAQIATGDHDDPPFDIRRIDAERRDSRDIEPIPAAFVGMVSINANKKSPDKSFDSPAKFANYHYVRRTSGWYFSDLEGSQCEDSRLDLPDNVGYDDEADFDISGAEQSCIALEDVPGLLEYEAILAEETSMESDDLVLVVPDHEPRREDVTLSTSIHRGLEDSPIEYMDEDEDYISSSPSSPDSAIDESAAESDAASSVPPMAASTPMKQEIELFPRVRVVNQGYYTTSPPCYSPNGPSSYASSSPCYSPNGKSPVARVMPNLLPVKSARRRLNLDDVPDSPSPMGGRMPQASPSTPTTSGVVGPRRRRLQMDREMAAAASPALAVAQTPRRHARKPLTVTLPDPGTPLRALEDLWDSCSPLQQSCTPSRFERDSPLSPNQESCTPSRFERDSPLSPTASPEKTPRQEEQSSPAGARTWELLSPLQQSCTPSRFDRDSPLSPSPEKPKTPARKTGYKRGSPIVCGSPLGVIQRWWPSPQAPGFNASLGSPLVLVEAESLSETANLSGSGQSAAYPSARLEMLTRSARARAFLEQSARAEAAALGDQSSSSVASTSKRSWASPAGSEQGASRPRRRRAAAAAAAAALSLSAAESPSLPPKKRRRFRSPSPSPVRSLSQLGSDGPRVIVQATDQPQLQTYSLRSGRR